MGDKIRWEDTIEVWCCGKLAHLLGNMRLREAGAACTELMYQCAGRCGKSIFLCDAAYGGTPADPSLQDTKP